jgi:hypothetical protein
MQHRGPGREKTRGSALLEFTQVGIMMLFTWMGLYGWR